MMRDNKLAKLALSRVNEAFDRCCVLFSNGDLDGHCEAAEEHRAWAYVYERTSLGKTLH